MASRRRIEKELKYLQNNPLCICSADPVGDNIFKWQVTMAGAERTPYEGGVYLLSIRFPRDYPFKPPNIKFITPIVHVNINKKGNIDCDILKEDWSPALTISKVLFIILSCQATGGNADDPLVPHYAQMMKFKMIKFVQLIYEYNVKYAQDAIPNDKLKNLQRGLTPTECEQECQQLIDFFISKYCAINIDSRAISSIIIDFCGGDVGKPYQPFPSYEPWIAFCHFPERHRYPLEYKRRMKDAAEQYNKYRFKSDRDKVLITGYMRIMRQAQLVNITDAIISIAIMFYQEKKMGIFVKRKDGTHHGSTLTVHCLPSDHISTIKMIIALNTGIAVEPQILIYGGKQLHNDRCLATYNIQRESTLHLQF